MASQSLPNLISAVAILSGSESKTSHSPDLATLLKSRLTRSYELLHEEHPGGLSDADLKTLKFMTGKESLRLVEGIQSMLDTNGAAPSESGSSSPLLGTRDLANVRTLLSIIFNWLVAPSVAELELHYPGPSMPSTHNRRIIDLTEPRLVNDLPEITMRLLGLLFAPGLQSRVRQTWITRSILSQHAVDVLTPCLLVGWAPAPISEFLAHYIKDIRALTLRFINLLRPHEAISALATVMDAKRSTSKHVVKACTRLLSNQLMRPEGVSGLCIAVFGEDVAETGSAPLDKLEHIAKVLSTVPAATDPQNYYRSIIPHILALFRDSPALHKKAGAFTLSRMLSTTFLHRNITSAILLPLFHTPFLSPPEIIIEVEQSNHVTPPACHFTAVESLQAMQTFVLHADPSPTVLSRLLTPIAPELYTLVSVHRTSKTADPRLRESLVALLQTWSRIVSPPDAIGGLWRIIMGSGGDWELGLEGFTRSANPAPPPSISLLAAAELEARDDVDINANPFNLRPDPSEFVTFLKTMNRDEVSSEIFLRLLNEYRELKESQEQPKRTLLYLQLVLQIQEQLHTTVLSKPEYVTSFIKLALTSELRRLSDLTRKSKSKKGLGLDDLRIVEDTSDDEDSDDGGEEQGDGSGTGGKDEMSVTAITLLLSILEANADISPNNTPDLNDIFDSLAQLALHASTTVRQLAREARLVLTARSASTSTAATPTSRPERESAQAAYQEALKLLQDPIIPVRAHGLQILRDLVSYSPASASDTSRSGAEATQLDPALVPGILSIFLQSIQDDESYIFLNAVQGIAAMVDGYGKEALRGIMDVYLSGTGVGSSGVGAGDENMSKEELDARIRIGEALNTVIKRCGGALGLYVDILIPPLLTILRSSHLPTTLRTSTLSILAQCAATNGLALSAYSRNLIDACVELLQLEGVPLKPPAAKAEEKVSDSKSRSGSPDEAGNEDGGENTRRYGRQPDVMDAHPTTTSTKAAPLRRSALHFLSQLLRSHIASTYDARGSVTMPTVTLSIGASQRWMPNAVMPEGAISDVLLNRAAVVLGYVAGTDEDGVTRVMAREAAELVEQYKQATLGF